MRARRSTASARVEEVEVAGKVFHYAQLPSSSTREVWDDQGDVVGHFAGVAGAWLVPSVNFVHRAAHDAAECVAVRHLGVEVKR